MVEKGKSKEKQDWNTYVGSRIRAEVEEELKECKAHDERDRAKLVELAGENRHCTKCK